MPNANHPIDDAHQAPDEHCAQVPEAHAPIFSEGHLQVQDLQQQQPEA
jgi:hypothetical protein